MLSRRVLSLRYFAFESIVSARPTRVVTLVNSLLPFLVSLVREGQGVDAVGGAEAIISHVMSQVCMCKCMCVCWRMYDFEAFLQRGESVCEGNLVCITAILEFNSLVHRPHHFPEYPTTHPTPRAVTGFLR